MATIIHHGHSTFKTAPFLESGRDNGHLAPPPILKWSKCCVAISFVLPYIMWILVFLQDGGAECGGYPWCGQPAANQRRSARPFLQGIDQISVDTKP